MALIRRIFGLVFFLFIFSNCLGMTSDVKGYIISAGENALSERWALYFYNHLLTRTNDKSIVVLQKNLDNKTVKRDYKTIHFEVSSNLKNDYCIDQTSNWLNVHTRNDQVSIWLIYQIIGNIAINDNRFVVKDLPPPIISLSNGCVDFDFDYREPHFAPNLQAEYAPILGTNNLETDWGIWGHNVSRIFNNQENDSLYALVNGKRTKAQFCFSSNQFLKELIYYVTDNFGKGDKKSTYFMISPQDNDLVCTCSECLKLGNTPNNASPAVANLIRIMSLQFPKHYFYMTAYRTNATPPSKPLPLNSGVFISTINLPKGIRLNENQPKTQFFLNQLEAWRAKTLNIYLWDYAANFDDFITPIPVLYSLQEQLQFFKKHDVKGIFINASGYDFSSFDDLKTYVSAALMINTNFDIAKLCKIYFNKEYPVSSDLLLSYYMSLEQKYYAKKRAYNLYGGMRENLNTYLNTVDFINFYDALKTIIPKTKNEERKKLQKLYTALSYTRLQIAYVENWNKYGYAIEEINKITVKGEITNFLKTLKGHTGFQNMKNYNESGNTLSDYITEWDRIVGQGSFENKLLKVPIELLSNPDEGFETTSLLKDGTSGFAKDYHQGWYLASTDNLHLRFSTAELNKVTIRLQFLNNPRHGIFPPEKIDLIGDGKLLKSIPFSQIKDLGETAVCTINIDFSNVKCVELKMIRKEAKKSTIACDEIRVLGL